MKSFLLAAAMTPLLAAGAQAVSVSLETTPTPPDVIVGDTFEVALITSSDFGTFTGVNIDVTYDADILSYLGTTFDPVFDFAQNDQSEPPGAAGGTTVQNITAATLFGSGSGEATLATLTFEAVGVGAGAITVTGTAGQLVVGLDSPFDQTVSVTATVAPIPLPSTALLLSGALLGLGVLRRKLFAGQAIGYL